jgi:predicted transcriptional regulator
MDLKEYMHARGLNNINMAHLLDVAPSCICNYLAGSRKPRLEIARKIEKVTHGVVKIDDLLEYYNNKQGRKNK